MSEHPTKDERLPPEARVEFLEAELERTKADYLGACRTIAQMHAAATGQPVGNGPVFGVLEDVQHLRQRAEELREALIWASGSADFSPGGQAREGWLKVRHLCDPIFQVKQLGEGG